MIGHGREKLGNPCLTEDAGFKGTFFRRKLTFVKAGDYKAAHDHPFGHMHFVTRGVVHIECPALGIDLDFEAGDALWIPPNAEHFIYGKTDGAIGYCVFSGRTLQGELADTPEEVNKDPRTRAGAYR